MPQRDPRTSGPVAPEIVLQCDLGGLTIAFTELIPGSSEEVLNARLDLYTRCIGRQRARVTLTEKLIDLLALKKTVKETPDRLRKMLAQRILDRQKIVGGFEEQHIASNRRGDFRMNDQQRATLRAFDAQTELDRKKIEDEKAGFERDIPIIETQLKRLRAVIAGGDPLEPLEAETKELSDAAD